MTGTRLVYIVRHMTKMKTSAGSAYIIPSFAQIFIEKSYQMRKFDIKDGIKMSMRPLCMRIMTNELQMLIFRTIHLELCIYVSVNHCMTRSGGSHDPIWGHLCSAFDVSDYFCSLRFKEIFLRFAFYF